MPKPFKTTLLDQHLRKKRRENEKSRQQTLRQLLRALPQLATRYGFERAYVFGSLAKKGRFRNNSDVDIAVEGLTDEKYFKFMAALYDLLGREVDVIQIERHHLKERIIETGIEWRKNA
ncbi:MAG: nucleotidyltransferase domain-containing protein [candidate division KSB1 bacterium]|nr:nucleotidyltransferase domain-containing protein [candidate division KSB1 bacterium]MDZ7365905.1 nucleotidyltransferase domain-containing protein [candidate division KSB1 bacterium]MDZ7403861.1 nucleotidyltransferase domain-containing protein [candidate division KSB1 bacterium]